MKITFSKFELLGRVFHYGKKARVLADGIDIGEVTTSYDREETYSAWTISSYHFRPSAGTAARSTCVIVGDTAAEALRELKSEILEDLV